MPCAQVPLVSNHQKYAVPCSSPKAEFRWGGQQIKAFEQLKHCLIHAPVLTLPDPEGHYEVVCDASGFGTGAVLLQTQNHIDETGRTVAVQKPVAFHSHKLSSAERNYPVGEQELLAVVLALKQWRCYLEGAKGGVTVVTDHKPNTFLDSKPSAQSSSRQVHWQEFLVRIDFNWDYRKGCANVADPISRCPSLYLITTEDDDSVREIYNTLPISGDFLSRVREGYDKDPWFADSEHTKPFTFSGGYWRDGELILVPSVGDLRQKCMSLHHDTPYAGHLGRDRTKHLIMQTYWWPSIDADVREFVSTCDFCQRNKPSNQKPAGLLQPLPIPEFRWQSVSVDLITELPKTKAGHTAICVFVDRLSKMVHFAPCWNDLGSQEFAQIFLREIFSKHGIPEEIVSDRGTQFTSGFWKEVSKLLGLKRALSSSRHPQSDGQTERANRTLEDMLRHFVSPTQDDWDLRLPCCEFAINNAWNQATDSTPFFLNYGEHPRTPTNVDVVCRSRLPAVDTFVGRIKDSINRARDSLKNAQARMCKNQDAKRRAEAFQVGEFAFLSTKGIRLSSVGAKKLMSQYLGPFEVIRRIGAVAYELCLPASMQRIHPVFHVSLLRKYKGSERSSAAPPAILLEGEEECEIESILDHRSKPTSRNPNRRQYLVHWRGRGREEDEWLFDNELSNAADAVQDYLDGLRHKDRPAARVGKPDEVAATSSITQTVKSSRRSKKRSAEPAEPASQPAPKRGRGRPRKR